MTQFRKAPMEKFVRFKPRRRKRVLKVLIDQLIESVGCPAQMTGCTHCDGIGDENMEVPGVCSRGRKRQCWIDEAREQVDA